MTYGWAILIIAVVLAALFELGVFNPMTFAPKASPGSCQVVRPEGAGTTNFISLEGECNGELPQYVAQFNGQSSSILVSGSQALEVQNFTVTFWISFNQGAINYWGGIFDNTNPNSDRSPSIWQTNGASGACLYIRTGGGTGTGCAGPNGESSYFNLHTLYFVSATKSGGTLTVFVNGKQTETASAANPMVMGLGTLYIGASEDFQKFNGSIANVQFYNTALSANDIQALYQEGIGGAPIKIQSLVGWWPLNGNANDYSGNGNNGAPSGVTYTSNWYSGYSAP